MAAGARSNPNNCANASNPYHVCTQACLQPKTKHSISNPHPHPHKTRTQTRPSTSATDAAAGVLGKKVNQERRKYAGCPKASNPYHTCDDNCNKTSSSSSASEGGTPLKYETKKKAAPASPISSKPEPPVIDNVPASKVGAIYLSDASSSSSNSSSQKKDIISDEHIPTVEQAHSGEIHHHVQDQLNEEEDKVIGSSHHDLNLGLTKSADSSFGERQESGRIEVGGYRVKESFGGILRSILDKYGDIGASCQLESVVMRSYYIECVCFVVQELQSASATTTMHHLTNSKLNELSAILKDVESAELSVHWLRTVLDEIISHNHQDHVQEAKAQVESLRDELDSQLQTLALKEQEVSDIKTRIIPEIRDRLSQLELKSSDLHNTIQSINSML